MKHKTSISVILLLLTALSCKEVKESRAEEKVAVPSNNKNVYQASVVSEGITIDGLANEGVWKETPWYPIDQLWVGKKVDENDLSGKFKVAWSKDYLYVLARIEDDTLMDIHDDKLVQYWDDDCLEIFIDEDASGGNHQYNFNAFAYHIALDYSVADIGTDETPLLLNDHLDVKMVTEGNTHTWEVAIKIYDDTFLPNAENAPIELVQEKTMGFAIAYCDNDFSSERETFIGSERIEGEDKNRGWIDAGIFGQVKLVE